MFAEFATNAFQKTTTVGKGDLRVTKKRPDGSITVRKNHISHRIGWIDSLRAIGMIAIIFNHLTAINMDWKVLVLAFDVPIFFLISGALMKAGKFENYLDCVKHAAKSLLVPYVVIYLINIPLYILNSRILGDWVSEANSFSVLLNGMLIANKNIMNMAALAAWFLPTCFLTTIVAYVIDDLFSDNKLLLWCTTFLSLLAAFCCNLWWNEDMVWHLNMVPFALFFYLLGYLLMPYAKRLVQKIFGIGKKTFRACSQFLVVLVGIAAVAGGSWLTLYSYHATGKHLEMFKNMIGAFPIATVACLLIIIGFALVLMMLPRIKPLELFGRTTLATLAFHRQIIMFLELDFVAGWWLDSGDMNVLICGIGVTVLMFFLSYAIYRFAPFLVGLPKEKAAKLIQLD